MVDYRKRRFQTISKMESTRIGSNNTIVGENILEKEKKERKEETERLEKEAAQRLEIANFNLIGLATPERNVNINRNTSTIRNRFNFGAKAKKMTSVTISNINSSSSSTWINPHSLTHITENIRKQGEEREREAANVVVPADDFDTLIEELQETENTKQNAAIAAETRLPTDDFDENPFGHNLGMDDDNEQNHTYTTAQLAGPPDAVF